MEGEKRREKVVIDGADRETDRPIGKGRPGHCKNQDSKVERLWVTRDLTLTLRITRL